MNAPFNPQIAGIRDPFAAFVCDDATSDLLRSVANEFGWPMERVNKGGLRNAVQALSVTASPQILFVDLSESGDPLNDISALAEVCEPGTMVIAAGHVNDVRLYRDLINSGIQDYLLKPLSQDQVREAFSYAIATLTTPKSQDKDDNKAHLISAFIGVRGGVGASTLATSVAWLLSDKHQHPTALLDLDVYFGTGALSLDLDPGRGLTDAIENPSRIDGLFLERAMMKANNHLSVLSAEAPINQPILTDGAAFYLLEAELKNAFEHTIIDLPRNMIVQYPQLIAEVQTAVVVTELTLAATRDTIRILSWLNSHAPNSKIVLVANKIPIKGETEILQKDFEDSIERKVDYIIPYDPKLAMQAAKLGKPLGEVAKNNKVSEAFDLLLAELKHKDFEDLATASSGKSLDALFKSFLSKKIKMGKGKKDNPSPNE